MSIKEILEILKERCDEKVIFPIDPSLSGDPIIRTLFVSAEINTMLQDNAEGEVWSEVRAIMDTFVSGGLISVGHKATSRMAFLKPKKNESVWEIRATKPKPGIRILGQFIEKDLFVALVWGYRKDLKNYNSIAWKRIIRNCKVEWRKLFEPYEPLMGETYNDYVSNIFLN